MSSSEDDRRAQTQRQLEALRRVIDFAVESKAAWDRTTAVDWILYLTTDRSLATAMGVSNLLVTDLVAPAQMLCRPLFEDMIVVHWLLMQDEAKWLVDRFFDHADNALLRDYDHWQRLGLRREGDPGLAEALRRREQLGTAGTYRDPFWWAAEQAEDGSVKRRTVDWVVRQLQTHQPYVPRLWGGDEPALQTNYALTARWANESLHHSPRGLGALLGRDGRTWNADIRGQSVIVGAMAYWTLCQTIYAQLTCGVADNDFTLALEFDRMFAEGLVHAHGMTLDDVRDALADVRRRSADAGGPVEF